MAVNYTDLFEDLGEFVEAVNLFRGWANTTLAATLAEIMVELAGNGRYDVMEGVPSTFDSYRDSATQMAEDMSRKAQERLRHRDTVLEQLPWQFSGQGESIGDADFFEILWRDMEANSQSILNQTCSCGSVSAGSGNYGDAQVVTTIVLDGVNGPGNGFPANPKYKGVNSELLVASELMRLTCIADSETDGVAEGSEQFRWDGGVPGIGAYDWRSEGSGEGPQVTMANASSLVLNGEFEDFETANTPDNWDVDAGTVGTHIYKEASGSEVKRGDAALKFSGDGAQATIQVSQSMVNRGLEPNRAYCVGLWVKGQAGIAAGALAIKFTGTGYTEGSTEKITMNAAALAAATSYTFKYFFVNMPVVIPEDFELMIQVGSTLTTAKSARFDGLAMVPVEWHGGQGVAVFAGATKTLRADIFTWTNANDAASAFQEFFRRFFRVQLRSAGSPSLANALASD